MKRQLLLPCSQKHNPPWTPDMGEPEVGRIPSFRQGIQNGEYPELGGEILKRASNRKQRALRYSFKICFTDEEFS